MLLIMKFYAITKMECRTLMEMVEIKKIFHKKYLEIFFVKLLINYC